MNVLVLNCGSSSIKYKLYNMDNEAVLAQGGVERIGLDEAFIKITLPNGEKKIIMHDMPDHKEGVNFVFKCLLDPEFGAIKDLKEIDAVGHRVVQGGDKFKESVIVDKSVEAPTNPVAPATRMVLPCRRSNSKPSRKRRAISSLYGEFPIITCLF